MFFPCLSWEVIPSWSEYKKFRIQSQCIKENLLPFMQPKVSVLSHCMSWDWLWEMNTGASCNYCWCLSIFGFLKPDLSPKWSRNRCFLVTLCCLIVRLSNLKVTNKRLLHQKEKILGWIYCLDVHGLPCCAWKCIPTSISGGMDIPKVLKMNSQRGSQ